MSRKVKFSQNWSKARRRVQKLHSRIACVRKDFLHKATSTISKTHAIVCIEDLQVSNMSRSARGSAASPGKGVNAKSGLNKSILDQGWYEFRRQLEYKLAWNGGQLIRVPAHHTSQTCPACQHVSPENRRTQGQFHCIECSYENHADVVGAINILERGLRLSACGEEGAGLARKRKAKPASKKQEPAEETHAIAA
jgi:putative transposase